MPLPLVVGLGSLAGGAVFKYSKKVFQFGLLASFIAAITSASLFFFGLFSSVYEKIQGSIDGLGTTYGGLLGCVVNSLGLDSLMTSALAIFVSASLFWGLSSVYILAFKLSKLTYIAFLKM